MNYKCSYRINDDNKTSRSTAGSMVETFSCWFQSFCCLFFPIKNQKKNVMCWGWTKEKRCENLLPSLLRTALFTSFGSMHKSHLGAHARIYTHTRIGKSTDYHGNWYGTRWTWDIVKARMPRTHTKSPILLRVMQSIL